MNKMAVVPLQKSRLFYTKLFKSSDKKPCLTLDYQGQAASDFIKETLTSDNPCMICRFGSNELKATLNYIDVISDGGIISKSIKYIQSKIGPFWWDEEIMFLMHNIAGFFPPDSVSLGRFANTTLSDIQNIDILGSWVADEVRLKKYFPETIVVQLTDLEPYYHANPWTEVLKDKKVLVIHPYEESIKKQYVKRHVLFTDPRTLPNFELKTFKAVQSIAANKTEFSNWFDALGWMCKRVQGMDFEIAIIGAGAYGLSLASFIKRIGKKAVHLGGATQILFGIKGKRWDESPFFRQLYNENWVRPLPAEIPDNFQIVESGCYW